MIEWCSLCDNMIGHETQDHPQLAASDGTDMAAVRVLAEYGTYDGDHHKNWAIDQAIRVLLGDRYDDWVADYEKPDENGDECEWDTGIAP